MLHAEQRDASAAALLCCAALRGPSAPAVRRSNVQNSYAVQMGEKKPNCLTGHLKKKVLMSRDPAKTKTLSDACVAYIDQCLKFFSLVKLS